MVHYKESQNLRDTGPSKVNWTRVERGIDAQAGRKGETKDLFGDRIISMPSWWKTCLVVLR